MARLDLTAAPTGSVIAADGGRVAVWDSGDGAKPAVALVHGFPENRLCWRPVLERLREGPSGFRWVAYDLRGFGESSKTGQACWQRLVADHLEVARQLGLERYHLVGHDWGAAIALHVARVAPESLASACVLNTTFWKVDYRGMWHMWLMNLPVVPRLLFGRAPHWFFEKTMVRAFNQPQRLEPGSHASYLQMFRDRTTTDFWIRLYRHSARYVLASALPLAVKRRVISSGVELPPTSGDAFKLPFRLIWGVDDTFCPLWVGRAIERRLQGFGAEVDFHEVGDSGHFVTEEQPAKVAELVESWLNANSC